VESDWPEISQRHEQRQRGNDLEINARPDGQARNRAQVAVLAMPTTVVKMIDMTTTRIALIKTSPNGVKDVAKTGLTNPMTAPEGDGDHHLYVQFALERRKASHRSFLVGDVGCSPSIRCIKGPLRLNAAYRCRDGAIKKAASFRCTQDPNAAGLRRGLGSAPASARAAATAGRRPRGRGVIRRRTNFTPLRTRVCEAAPPVLQRNRQQ